MPMLSQLLRYRVVDQQQRSARLVDVAVQLSAGEYPPVSHLVWRDPNNQQTYLRWDEVRCVDDQARVVQVDDLGRGRPTGEDWLARIVLLNRDILDVLIIDLKDRLVLRANDLWLEPEGSGYNLRGVDIGLRAVARRLTGGLVAPSSGRLRDWRVIEFLRGDPAAARNGADYHGLTQRLPAGEIANLADALPYLHAAELVTLLPDEKAADTLEAMTAERQLQVFEELDDEQAGRLLSLMRPDLVADLLGRLHPDQAHYWLEHMPRAQYKRVLRLLQYPEDTAGGIMTNDMVVLPESMPAKDALRTLREQLKLPAFINFIQMVYVVDDATGRRLKGVMSLRDLLISEENKNLVDCMNPYTITIKPLERALQAATRVIDSELTALPVVGENGHLLGVVTIDAALLLVTPPAWSGREAPKLFS